jgi:hypothetical protein
MNNDAVTERCPHNSFFAGRGNDGFAERGHDDKRPPFASGTPQSNQETEALAVDW